MRYSIVARVQQDLANSPRTSLTPAVRKRLVFLDFRILLDKSHRLLCDTPAR